MIIHVAEKPTPLGSRTSVLEQEMRAIFVRGIATTAWPMVVRNDVFKRNSVFFHHHRRQFSRAVESGAAVVATVLAHFNPNGQAVTRAAKIRVFALLVGGHVLNGDFLVHGKMPDKVSNPIAGPGFWRAKRPFFQGQSMARGIGAVVLRAVDCDVARRHRAHNFAPVRAFLDHVISQIHLTQEA